MRRNKPYKSVRMGRGSVDAIIVSTHMKVCDSCGAEIWWAARRDDPSRKFPIHRIRTEEGGAVRVVWYAHHIHCPVNGVLARKTGQQPML